jgi:hypothetical protein
VNFAKLPDLLLDGANAWSKKRKAPDEEPEAFL